MAPAFLNQEDVKVLENLRQRIFQLTNNIASLKSDVMRSNPLPPWNSLQTSASILASNIETLTSLMSKNAELLNKTVVYPSTNYPGRTQEGILTELLRKKLEPGVETWVDEARATQASVAETKTNEKDETELLEWVRAWIGPRIIRYIKKDQGNYTLEERKLGRENVNTGLRREFPEEDEPDEEDDEEEEDDDDDEEMEDVGVAVTSVRRSSVGEVEFGLSEVKKVDPNAKMRNIEDILRFATTGVSVDQVGPRR
ncbi:mediator of RNA polymerase II transcription subunit 8 [Cadophora gregata]|uniref:mediator of RNA polymerase II transcription subunit 8 n=1 Tax=Cadophora gregata TaxID=51156 RepID=UPI0026DCB03E|nr:mediator of RNA polymerase II transcription subunit 8 [Cadophora gregata]KAK0101296.1 mediator of RNA polymerase II transcription subunit 8 [Cadophora gregata]KAK0106694.1 mediator of RNA polymerase II transcription subunit 8 [Cadophora gregata f. sp. sojae]